MQDNAPEFVRQRVAHNDLDKENFSISIEKNVSYFNSMIFLLGVMNQEFCFNALKFFININNGYVYVFKFYSLKYLIILKS